MGIAVYQLNKNGLPLAPTQSQLTPLQREVLLASIAKEAEEKEKAMNQAGGSSGGHDTSIPQQNSMSNKKTVESRHFVNTGPNGVDDFEQEEHS